MACHPAPPKREMFGVEQLLLVEEITHRVINEYAVAIAWINIAAETIVDPDAQAVLCRTESRLRALVNAHRALQAPAIGLDLDLGNYLERLCAALAAASLRPARVQLFLHEESIVLTPDRCWRVGLIIAELITNSMRHGSVGAPAIAVDVRLAGDHVRCEVTDWGGNCADPGASRGRRVIERLARDLGGAAGWRFGSDGVTAVLAFPWRPS
jgi:two-component sensor histidine kinase